MSGRKLSNRLSIRGDVAPSKVEAQLVRDSSFSTEVLSLSSSVKGSAQQPGSSSEQWNEAQKKILFTDLMRVATDIEFARKMNNVADMYKKILECHINYSKQQVVARKHK